jgi:M6 family metalloprotease-like protein
MAIDLRSRRAARFALRALVAVSLLLVQAAISYSAPARDTPFVLRQPDGTPFVARQFGDEWMNGTETTDGYTIIKDARSGVWTYADVTQAGKLAASPYVVGRDLPYALPRFVRPRVNVKSRALAGPKTFTLDAAADFSGTKNILAILVEFDDTPATTTAGEWQSRFFGASASVKDFYDKTSYGALTLVPAEETSGTNDGIVGWLRLPGNHPNFGGNIAANAPALAQAAMTAAAPFIDYAAFDTNGNGFVSESELLIIIVVAGNDGAFGECSPRIWAHQFHIDPAVTLDGKKLAHYVMVGEKHCEASDPAAATQATIGPIVHETGHLLGLPDLYDIDDSSEGVGRWSVMGRGLWNEVTQPGDSPALMDAWSKATLGWVIPIMVAGTLRDQAIPDAATSPGIFRFLTGGEYFLVENRNGGVYDAGLPSTGLLIWHIDDGDGDERNNTQECSPRGETGLPACSATVHPRVRLVQADNLYDLEHSPDGEEKNRGDAGDPFPGTSNRRAFTKSTTPNSKKYSGAASNVFVTRISDSGPTMTATLRLAPDVITTAATTVAAASPGQSIAVTNTVTNGPVAVGPFIVGFYLSPDREFDDGSDVMLGARLIASMAVEGTNSNVQTLTIPAATPPGIYRILVRADAGDELAEGNERDNLRATAPIVIGRDVSVTVATTVATASAGQQIAVNNTVKNTGSVPITSAFRVGLYLSTNQTFEEGTDVALRTRTVAELAVGARSAKTNTVTIPPGTPPGTYYILVRADARGVLSEASESNNLRATAPILIGP